MCGLCSVDYVLDPPFPDDGMDIPFPDEPMNDGSLDYDEPYDWYGTGDFETTTADEEFINDVYLLALLVLLDLI